MPFQVLEVLANLNPHQAIYLHQLLQAHSCHRLASDNLSECTFPHPESAVQTTLKGTFRAHVIIYESDFTKDTHICHGATR